MEGDTWDAVQTIFPFLLYHAGDGGLSPLGREGTLTIFRQLPEARSGLQRGRLGQPVLCGSRQGTPVSALRLCVSARTVIMALQGGGPGEERAIHEACVVLDQAALLTAAAPFRD